MLTITQRQIRNSPIIVGEQYELVETVAAAYGDNHSGGLLAKPDYTTAILSMSGYEKAQNSGLNDHDPKRPLQDYTSLTAYNLSQPSQVSAYMGYAVPSFSDPLLQPQSAAYDRNVDQMSYGTSSVYQPRAAYDATDSSYSAYHTRKIPEPVSYNPQQGRSGTHVYVHLDSSSELLGPSPLIASLMFASRRVPAALNRTEPREHDVCYKYVVTADAPELVGLDARDARISLHLQLQEQSGLDRGTIFVGPWLYLPSNGKQYGSRPVPDFTRKRKSSEELYGSAKRSGSPQAQAGHSQNFVPYSYRSDTGSTHNQSLHSIDVSSMQRKLTPYGRKQYYQGFQDDPTSLPYSQSLMRPPNTRNSPRSSSYTEDYRPSRIPGMSSAPPFVTSAGSASPAYPPLVRASTISTQPGSASTSGGSSSDGSFNPYTLFPSRATINICGKLSTMQEDWTAEESVAKRRLVLFRGEQTDSTVNTYFRAVKPNERPTSHAPRERQISCIYWDNKDKDKHFVTSVDTIALLETLVGARFTVEEKNRIRRNLETHQPVTVSKAKKDTEEFFKTIMGFPNPKPRNIEKDVKVFAWSSLENALKKVIGKYSASHSSIAGPLSRTHHSRNTYTHTHNTQPSRTEDLYIQSHGELSSRSASSGSSVFAQTPLPPTLSPPNSLAGPYSQPSPIHPSLSQPYNIPTIATEHVPDNLSTLGGYNLQSQISIPDLTQAYTSSAIGRRRSSEANSNPTPLPTSYTIDTPISTRPRAHTSFAALYPSQEIPGDYNLQLPTAGQPLRGSWDFTSYLQPETNVVIPESPQSSQYRRASMAQAAAGANQDDQRYVEEETGPGPDEGV